MVGGNTKVQIFGAYNANPSDALSVVYQPTSIATDANGNVWTRLVAGGAGGTPEALDTIPWNTASGVTGTRGIPTLSMPVGWNGPTNDTWFQLLVASATNFEKDPSAPPRGALMTSPYPGWSLTHMPVSNTKATITQGALGGIKHVCTAITAVLSVEAATPTGLQVVLRDGPSGGGTIKWGASLQQAGGTFRGSIPICISGLNIVGTDNTAMTLEFSAAPGASNFESVALTGFSVTDN